MDQLEYRDLRTDQKYRDRVKNWIFTFSESQKVKIARKAAEKTAVANILGDTSENIQNDDMSWYFNRTYDDPLDRLEGYENEVQQENLYFWKIHGYLFFGYSRGHIL